MIKSWRTGKSVDRHNNLIEIFVMIGKKEWLEECTQHQNQMDEVESVGWRLKFLRIRILKSRQQGAMLFAWLSECGGRHENASYAVVAHKETSA